MKQKMKKIFENAVWWSGVVMVGLVLGISLQVVKAWTEPTEAPPGGNVGAPINTSLVGQWKKGLLQLGALTLINDPAVSGMDVTGKVLTAQNAYGATAWAAGGGGGTCYTNFGGSECGLGFTAALTGYATYYYNSGGASVLGGLICSSIKHDSISGGLGFAGVSDTSKYSNVRNESCAICCK